MAMIGKPDSPPHGEGGSLSYSATKTQARGAPGRQTPLKGPNARAPGDTGKSGRMPTGAHTDGILGKPRRGHTT